MTGISGAWLFLLLIPAGLIMWRRFATGRRDLLRIAGYWREDELGNLFLVKWFFSSLTFAFFIIFGTLAVLGVAWGKTPIKEDRQGLDIGFVVDISRSMLCTDVEPNRLGMAIEAMGILMDSFPQSRFSVILFKGDAYKFSPATEDWILLKENLKYISPGILTAPGTNVEKGLLTALTSFPPGEEKNQVLVLFSDGEALEGDSENAWRQAVLQGIPVVTVGLGTEEGGEIVLADGRIVKNSKGEKVITRLSETELERIAEETGGAYFRGEGVLMMQELKSYLEELSSPKSETDFRYEPKNRFRLFILLALISLAINQGIRILKWKELF
jgi:Ca-activated chloride channel family protein